MSVKVVDASAICALLFAEAEAQQVAARLRGSDLVASALLEFEVASVCLKKVRRAPERRDAHLTALSNFAQMAVDIAEVDQADVLTIALATGLSSYDASYLYLARKLGAELVTLDKKLQAASDTTMQTD